VTAVPERSATAADPLLLAVDTSTAEGSVALGKGTEVLGAVRLSAPREHARRLVPAIEELLRAAGLARGDLGGIVVGEGPGSFTGVRIAAATVMGIAAGLDLPVWPHSTLAGVAATERPEGGSGRRSRTSEEIGWICSVLDARGTRIYAAWYRVGEGGLSEAVPPHAGTIDRLLAEAPVRLALYCGDGARRHRERIVGAGLGRVLDPGEGTIAEGLLRVHASDSGQIPPLGPGGWEPLYLRGSSAVPMFAREER
jgi:tRNA threonylcarbamoyladenosine biosynthesis protein TsaB